MVEDGVDTAVVVHDVDTVDLHVPAADVAEGSVVDGALLGEVDLLAGEHGIALLLEAGLLGQLDEEVEGLIGQEVLGEVEEDVGAGGVVLEGTAELGEAVGVVGEGLLQDEVLADVVAVSLELGPRGKARSLRHFGQRSAMVGRRRIVGWWSWWEQETLAGRLAGEGEVGWDIICIR